MPACPGGAVEEETTKGSAGLQLRAYSATHKRPTREESRVAGNDVALKYRAEMVSRCDPAEVAIDAPRNYRGSW